MEEEVLSFPFLWIGWGEKFEVTGQIAPLQLTPNIRSCKPLPKKEEMNAPKITLTRCRQSRQTQGIAGRLGSMLKMSWN
ncbi:hypothetical protein LDENG_00067700 [Lucifuga dentata]|nr:hypothetical protein LDENG_00067700 [Lucifuga dentata]